MIENHSRKMAQSTGKITQHGSDAMPDEIQQVSNAEVGTWKGCRRRWYLSYYLKLGLPRENKHGPRAIGTRVHACIDQYYKAKIDPELEADPLQLHDDLVKADIADWPEQEPEIKKDASLSRIMLEGYFEWLEETGADEGLTVVASEEEVRQPVELPAGVKVTIRGKLDLRVHDEHDDTIKFIDHKTVGDFTSPVRTLNIDEQMLMYDLLLRLAHPGENVDAAIYNMIRKVKRTSTAKPPFFMRFEVRHTREEVQTFYQRLIGVLDDIDHARQRLDDGEDHGVVCYPTPTRDCSWKCDFFHVCPLMNRPSDHPEEMLNLMYVRIDPYARYGAAERGTIGEG